VLFLDICKFSSRPAETEVEQGNLLRMLAFFFSELIKIIEDYGGVVEKNTGDGLMAYFVPEPGSDSTAQQIALAAALTIFATVDWLINPTVVASSMPKVDFRICIDHGFITVADVGAARRFRGIVAIGTTANVASKMLSFADANQLLIGDQMLTGLPGVWREKYVRLKSSETGWVYRTTGTPYHFWEYTGRWLVPTS
jgi:adenylate cyclase